MNEMDKPLFMVANAIGSSVKAEAKNALLWRCIRDLAIMLERDPDGIEEIAIERDAEALADVLGVEKAKRERP
jgi:hypothetical protein